MIVHDNGVIEYRFDDGVDADAPLAIQEWLRCGPNACHEVVKRRVANKQFDEIGRFCEFVDWFSHLSARSILQNGSEFALSFCQPGDSQWDTFAFFPLEEEPLKVEAEDPLVQLLQGFRGLACGHRLIPMSGFLATSDIILAEDCPRLEHTIDPYWIGSVVFFRTCSNNLMLLDEGGRVGKFVPGDEISVIFDSPDEFLAGLLDEFSGRVRRDEFD